MRASSRRVAIDRPARFKTLALDLAQSNGLDRRKRFIEGKSSYEIGRYEPTELDARVQPAIAVSPDLWRLFQ